MRKDVNRKVHFVRTFSFMLVVMLFAGCSINAPQPEPKLLSEIVGELVIEFDTSYLDSGDPYPFGSGPISTVFAENYSKHVKDFEKEERFTYFWVGLWNLHFQGGSMDMFVDVVRSDPDVAEYIDELRDFVQKSNEGGRAGWRTSSAEGALGLLQKATSN